MTHVCVSLITAGELRLETARSLTTLIRERPNASVLYHQSGPHLALGRNQIVRKFLSGDCDYLLMVDSDMEFTPENVDQLLADDLPLVAGTCYSTFGGNQWPAVFHSCNDSVGKRTMRPIMGWNDGWPNYPSTDSPPSGIQPLIEVEAVGAAFMMLRRDTLVKMAERYEEPMPWFAEDIRDGVPYGEDLSLCLRLTDMGGSIYVDRRVQIGHYKTVKLGY